MDCVFCKIVKKEIPSSFLHESDSLIVIKDMKPTADTHLLIIPKRHISTLTDIKKKNSGLIYEMFKAAKKFIKEMKLEKKYRVSFNGGSWLEVNHLHMHLLGGDLKNNYDD